MNEKLIEEVLKLVKDSANFVQGQAPEVVQQMLSYDAFAHTCWGWFFVGLTAVFLVVIGYAAFLAFTAPTYDQGMAGLLAFLAFMCLVGSGCGVVCNFGTIYQIKHYPKAYLVEKLTRSVK